MLISREKAVPVAEPARPLPRPIPYDLTSNFADFGPNSVDFAAESAVRKTFRMTRRLVSAASVSQSAGSRPASGNDSCVRVNGNSPEPDFCEMETEVEQI